MLNIINFFCIFYLVSKNLHAKIIGDHLLKL